MFDDWINMQVDCEWLSAIVRYDAIDRDRWSMRGWTSKSVQIKKFFFFFFIFFIIIIIDNCIFWIPPLSPSLSQSARIIQIDNNSTLTPENTKKSRNRLLICIINSGGPSGRGSYAQIEDSNNVTLSSHVCRV